MKKNIYITQQWYQNRWFRMTDCMTITQKGVTEVTDRITTIKKGSLIHLKGNINIQYEKKKKTRNSPLREDS